MIRNIIYILLAFYISVSFVSCNDNDNDDEDLVVKKEIKISILGDSYSTFEGFVTPVSNPVWYPVTNGWDANDVVDVKQMWWHGVLQEYGATLEINNSYSGATICNTGYYGTDSSSLSFIARMNNMGDPDIIFIFGGTNDSWANSPVGDYKYHDWTTADLKSFRPAFAYMLDYLTKKHPDARIINIVNTGLKEVITESQTLICDYYKIKSVQLMNIEKQSNHPNINGMNAIKKQIMAILETV
ncbi:hypothetical protein D0T84_10450 [Dysgonomonas sp. 521]|uniref:SGNH/GDSL hydrolase family protein n=1 Tax=Dysgonomonas sp. 521 TaxID=2302932 RepID=UPI0013CFD020|nr:SGNH/GDSL hydrolase family protein [Dysgonomonas sp. 521]NDV95338.1 hypothetical protein [Dysgonomonas sp. 521]